MNQRRIYSADFKVNGLQINRIVIDPHFEKKHGGSISEEDYVGVINAFRRD